MTKIDMATMIAEAEEQAQQLLNDPEMKADEDQRQFQLNAIATIAVMMAAISELAKRNEELENRLSARIDTVEENGFTDELRAEIIREASQTARDDIEWELNDKAEEYELRELESRVEALEDQE